jgi:hypothetical protein
MPAPVQEDPMPPASRPTGSAFSPAQQTPGALVIYDRARIAEVLKTRRGVALDLKVLAEEALTRGPFSVMDKTDLAPSSKKQDYWHPAPYWWPDPETPDGLPYIRRDGQRVPGTRFNDPESGRYDRTRLKAVFDDTTHLALAAEVFDEPRFADHAARLIRAWFLTPETRMTPHLRYAQVRRGHNGDEGPGSGIIEFRDVFYVLDAMRLLEERGALSPQDTVSFRGWLARYADWLQTSTAGQRECKAMNNHGTFFDVQLGAIAAYLGDHRIAAALQARLPQRLAAQFAADGSQPHELKRSDTRHYVCFNLYAWTMLARVAAALGIDLWQMQGPDGAGMKQGFAWLIDADARHHWTETGSIMFQTHRMAPLWTDCQTHYPDLGEVPSVPQQALKRILFPNFDIVPLWGLTRP